MADKVTFTITNHLFDISDQHFIRVRTGERGGGGKIEGRGTRGGGVRGRGGSVERGEGRESGRELNKCANITKIS